MSTNNGTLKRHRAPNGSVQIEEHSPPPLNAGGKTLEPFTPVKQKKKKKSELRNEYPLTSYKHNTSVDNTTLYLYTKIMPPFGAIHHPTIMADYKFHSPNVSASLATSPGAPPYHVFIPP